MKKLLHYYFGSVVGLALTFGLSIVYTHFLPPAEFGVYRIIIDVLTLVTALCAFGLGNSAARLVALAREPDEQARITGAALRRCLVQAIAGSFLVAGVAWYFTAAKGDAAYKYMFIAAPFALVYLAKDALANIQIGLARIEEYALYECLPSALVLVASLGMVLYYDHLSLPMVVGATLCLQLVAVILRAARLRPVWSNLGSAAERLGGEIRSYGLHVYAATLGGVVTSQATMLFAATLVPAGDYGHLSLAIAISGLLTLIGTAYGASSFGRFVHMDRIPRAEFARICGVTLAGLGAFLLGIGFFVRFVFPPAYEPVARYASVLALGTTLHGIGEICNRYLNAKGEGKIVNRVAWATGLTSFVLTLVLALQFGTWGMVIGRAALGVAFFVFAGRAYLKYRRNQIKLDKTVSPDVASGEFSHCAR